MRHGHKPGSKAQICGMFTVYISGTINKGVSIFGMSQQQLQLWPLPSDGTAADVSWKMGRQLVVEPKVFMGIFRYAESKTGL